MGITYSQLRDCPTKDGAACGMTTPLLAPGADPHMSDITEKRVHDDDAGATEVVVAAGIGIVSVSVSGGHIGRFGVAHRCTPRDVAGGEGVLTVATEEGVLRREGEAFVATGFGPAVAVGVREGSILAAGEGGRIARLERGGDAWTDLGTVDAAVRAVDGALVATEAGVYRVRTGRDGGAVEPVGLDAANDVAARGPYAATGTGLYALGNGWMEAIEGEFRAVAAASRERVCAAGDGVYVRDGDGWRTVDRSTADAVVGVAMGDRAYAVTGSGTVLAGHDWRSRSLGVREVVGITVA
jgi:hypothetical protein